MYTLNNSATLLNTNMSGHPTKLSCFLSQNNSHFDRVCLYICYTLWEHSSFLWFNIKDMQSMTPLDILIPELCSHR